MQHGYILPLGVSCAAARRREQTRVSPSKGSEQFCRQGCDATRKEPEHFCFRDVHFLYDDMWENEVEPVQQSTNLSTFKVRIYADLSMQRRRTVVNHHKR